MKITQAARSWAKKYRYVRLLSPAGESLVGWNSSNPEPNWERMELFLEPGCVLHGKTNLASKPGAFWDIDSNGKQPVENLPEFPKAKKTSSLADSMDPGELHKIVYQRAELEAQMKVLKQQHSGLASRVAELELQVQNKDARIRELEEELQDCEDELAEAREQLEMVEDVAVSEGQQQGAAMGAPSNMWEGVIAGLLPQLPAMFNQSKQNQTSDAKLKALEMLKEIDPEAYRQQLMNFLNDGQTGGNTEQAPGV